MEAPDSDTINGARDRAMLAVMIGCGLRRNEVAELTFEHVQMREARWVIVDLFGKHARVRSVPMPTFVKPPSTGGRLPSGYQIAGSSER